MPECEPTVGSGRPQLGARWRLTETGPVVGAWSEGWEWGAGSVDNSASVPGRSHQPPGEREQVESSVGCIWTAGTPGEAWRKDPGEPEVLRQ